LLGEIGNFRRFFTPRALVAYVGFFPVLHQSGAHTATPHLSHVGSRLARRVLYLAAVNAVRRAAEWHALYQRKRSQGKTAKQALIVVAVRLLHTAFAMLKHRCAYDAARVDQSAR
jgi:transposase